MCSSQEKQGTPNVFKTYSEIFKSRQIRATEKYLYFLDTIDKTDYHIIHIYKFDYCVFKHKEIILFVKVPLATLSACDIEQLSFQVICWPS